MTERIKLKEDDIYWSEEYHHLTILCDLKDYEQLKQQILDDHKKGTLFDSLQVENQTILDTISQVKIANQMCEQEIKQLKETLVHSIKNTDKAIDQFDIVFEENKSLKQTVEKIKEFMSSEKLLSNSYVYQELSKILEEKK